VDRLLDTMFVSLMRTDELINGICLPFMDGYRVMPSDKILFEEIEDSLPRTLVSGATDYLEGLKCRGNKVGLVTNSIITSIRLGVYGTDLRNFFDEETIVRRMSPEDPKKPHPYLYQRALSHFRVPPTEVTAYEDTPTGICAAKSAGIATCIGMATSGQHNKNLLLDAGAFRVYSDYTDIT
jgi:beta-phosphoglucomutase-like phosphatase (HAD superfamily)